LKILLAHNEYQTGSPSGEDIVFRMERELLERAGHTVVIYQRSNDDIGESLAARCSVVLEAVWSRRSHRDITELLQRERPDVAHFHNTFPLISPSAYRACQEMNIPVVQTLHNYRLICAGALLARNGQPCEDCVGRSPWKGVLHGCYRNSKAATAGTAAMLQFNRLRGSYESDVDSYIALTEFARGRFIRGGLPADKLVVRSNYMLDVPAVGTGNGGYALYAGRLTAEKGVQTLVRAWRDISCLPLKIVGDGALRPALEMEAKLGGGHIEFLGFRPRTEVAELMRGAVLAVIPSECYEGAFPLAAIEALATGTPVVASALGGLDEVIAVPDNGTKFIAGHAHSLQAAVLSLLQDPTALRQARINNRRLFEQRFAPERALSTLTDLYERLLHQRRSRQPAMPRGIGEAAVH
jgi:glycosyltransferase involved in cell wall biosynthesis